MTELAACACVSGGRDVPLHGGRTGADGWYLPSTNDVHHLRRLGFHERRVRQLGHRPHLQPGIRWPGESLFVVRY